METINNVATAAAKAVWGDGDTNREPVSGASGDVSKGEPYDAGNLEDADQKKVASSQDLSTEPKTTTDTKTTTDAKPAAADTTAGQNDTRKPEEVDADEPAADVTGPGPKPLEVIAKEHGGDAGKEADAAAADDKAKDGPGEDAPDGAKSEGTGEQYVKTSGLAADGGDFDATKPGAGREADRLMEQKGIVHPDAKAPSATAEPDKSPASPSSSKKDKPSLGDRIKAKLHKH